MEHRMKLICGFSSRRRHTRCLSDWSSDVCSSDLAAAEGHPAGVMDISFALQALSAEALARRAGELEPGVHAVPEEVDREVAALKLASLGIRIDTLSEE